MDHYQITDQRCSGLDVFLLLNDIDILEDSKLLDTRLLSYFVKNVYNWDEKISNTEPSNVSRSINKMHSLYCKCETVRN